MPSMHLTYRTSRLLGAILLATACPTFLPVASALEFSADQVVRSDGHTRKANLYYRDQMWRLEHNDLGPVSITIVRKDKKVTWFLLPRVKHFKTIPYNPEHEPMVAEHLVGEIRREEIGVETLEGHPTTLYQVTVQKGDSTLEYYQWLATDIRFPLKLARKDGSWQVQYRNVRVHPLSDLLFRLPLNYQPLEEFSQHQPSLIKTGGTGLPLPGDP